MLNKLSINLIFFSFTAGIFFITASVNAVEPAKSFTQVPTLQTLFMSKKMREIIDTQRQVYLHPVVERKVANVLPKDKTMKDIKRIHIPSQVVISAVMIKPDGSTLIRVNGKYNKSPSDHIGINFSKSTMDGVPVTVNGKTKIVPVGETLLTQKNRVVKTYNLEDEARNKQVQ